MNHRVRLARLTADEAASVRKLVEKHGAPTAARMLGLHSPHTVRKVAIGEPAQSLTVELVRARLHDTI